MPLSSGNYIRGKDNHTTSVYQIWEDMQMEITETVTISLKTYNQLKDIERDVKRFAEYVRNYCYSIDRETCAEYLDFSLNEEEEEE